MMISYIYKYKAGIPKTIKFESEAFKSFFNGYFPDEDQENTFTADFIMR